MEIPLGSIPLDKDGFLADLSLWNKNVAIFLAQQESIELTDAHWEIIELARQYYALFDHSPEMRPLIKFIKQELNADKGSSIYLLSLFPDSPAKLASKIAGLPRPANCL